MDKLWRALLSVKRQLTDLTSRRVTASIYGVTKASKSYFPLPAGPTMTSPGFRLTSDGCILESAKAIFRPNPLMIQSREMASLRQMHYTGPHVKVRPIRRPLDGNPFMKGVILKTLIKKPKKPNSANRKCVLVRLSNGKEAIAYIPGIGHNLQEHNIVLVRVGRLQDVPGVKLKCVRGVYDLPHVIKKST